MVAERYRKVPRPSGQKLLPQPQPLQPQRQLPQLIFHQGSVDLRAQDWPRGRGADASPKGRSGRD